MARWKVGWMVPGLGRNALSASARRCTASVAADNVNDIQRTHQDYAKALPFSAIPGPKGLPYIGTLLEYTRGRQPVCVSHALLIAIISMFPKFHVASKFRISLLQAAMSRLPLRPIIPSLSSRARCCLSTSASVFLFFSSRYNPSPSIVYATHPSSLPITCPYQLYLLY